MILMIIHGHMFLNLFAYIQTVIEIQDLSTYMHTDSADSDGSFVPCNMLRIT